MTKQEEVTPSALEDGLTELLDSYAELCAGDCEHSQCPLLRQLHALRIAALLERARLQVRPIVDREREAERIGDVMNIRLDASALALVDGPQETGDDNR
jgi:hypothetical protein